MFLTTSAPLVPNGPPRLEPGSGHCDEERADLEDEDKQHDQTPGLRIHD